MPNQFGWKHNTPLVLGVCTDQALEHFVINQVAEIEAQANFVVSHYYEYGRGYLSYATQRTLLHEEECGRSICSGHI